MNVAPYTVALVLDPEYGERLAPLAQGVHVWVVDTPTNQAAAKVLWGQGLKDSLENGVTTFTVSSEFSRAEQCLGILSTIELHHGEYSHSPPFSVLKVIGLSFSEELRSGFEELDFCKFEPTREGFIARKG